MPSSTHYHFMLSLMVLLLLVVPKNGSKSTSHRCGVTACGFRRAWMDPHTRSSVWCNSFGYPSALCQVVSCQMLTYRVDSCRCHALPPQSQPWQGEATPQPRGCH